MRVRALDASAFVELILRSDAGLEVERELRGCTVVAPAHFDAEVFSALGKLFRAGDLDEGRVEIGLGQLARVPLIRYPVAPLLRDAWALRHNLTLRDALYIALARRLKATFLTADARLARAPDVGVSLIVVANQPG